MDSEMNISPQRRSEAEVTVRDSESIGLSTGLIEALDHQGLRLRATKKTMVKIEAETTVPVVGWQKESPDHPRSWSLARRIYDTSVIVSLEFFTTVISTAVTPTAPAVQMEFGIGHTVAIATLLSTYMAGQAVGTIVLPPYSELFGRKTLFVASAGLYAAFCVFTSVIASLPAVIIGRFVTGLLSAVPSAIVVGSIEDMWNVVDRIFLVYILQTVTIVALALGPIMGAYITDASLDWHWLYYIAAIVTGINFLMCLFMRESRPSKILRHKIALIQSETGASNIFADNPEHTPNVRTFVHDSLGRPALLFFREPLVWIVSTLSATVWALIYLLTDALPLVYTSTPFSFTPFHASLTFISISFGAFLGLPIRLYDRRRALLTHQSHAVPSPESKLLGFYVAAPVLAAGLWWFAWSIPPLVEIHWFCSVASLLFLGFSANEFTTVLAGYLVDSYTTYAASALVPCGLMRCILSAVFPLFGRNMFMVLGANLAASVLAAWATTFCILPWIFWKWGRRIRERSPYAKKSAEKEIEGDIEGLTQVMDDRVEERSD